MLKITGVGAVTPYGAGTNKLFRGIESGLPPSPQLPAFFKLPFGDQIRAASFDGDLFDRKAASIDTLILGAIDEAIRDAGLKRESLRDAALVVGATGYVAEAEADYRDEVDKGNPPPAPLALKGAGDVTERLARDLGIEGPVVTVSTACTSGANALLTAERLLRSGDAGRAIVVGVELLNSLTMSGFNSLMLLSPDGCRPFDAKREGIHLGEAVGALILEGHGPASDESGLFLCGLSSICDTHNVISISPDGSSLVKVMESALQAAGVGPDKIVGIKAHGIGSRDNDSAEALAFRQLFDGDIPPFTSLKGYLGHTLAAAALVETIAFFRCVENGFMPVATGFSAEDPEIGISPAERPLPSPKGHYLLNFLGFGGSNTSMVLRYV